MEMLIQVTRWTAIIFFIPTVVLSVLNLANAIFLDGSFGEWVAPWAEFCLNVLAASFIVAIVLAIIDTRKESTEK